MNKLPFILWVMGWPLSVNLSEYLESLATGHLMRPASDDATGVTVMIWIAVAMFAYPWRKIGGREP